VFDKFPKYYIKILLGDFNAKVGKEDIFKPKIWNESLHDNSSDKGIRVVNFARVKIMIFLHRNIHKLNWNSDKGIRVVNFARVKIMIFLHRNIHKLNWNLLRENPTIRLTNL
jgi:hypothetical protein